MIIPESIKFVFITPTGVLYDREISQITVNTEMGPITILPEHDTIVSVLKPGEMIINEKGQDYSVAVAGGILEMSKNILVILADEAEPAIEIDVEAAEAAAAALAKHLEDEVEVDVTTYESLMRKLDYHKVRVQVGKKWRPHTSVTLNF